MGQRSLGNFLQHIRHVVAGPADATDRQLLERFTQRQDQSAFEALVRRHGPLVLGVCRRTLGEGPEAEDAFQATFLVLVRKASALPWQESIGSWLYQVSWRIAMKARSTSQRRLSIVRATDDLNPEGAEQDAPATAAGRENHRLLDEELQRLPSKYRAPLVLCFLEGKTHDEAAQQLGWPRGSMAKRVTRALELLRDRLTGRGVALSTATISATLAESAAAVPPALVDSTIKAATLFAAGEAAAGALAGPVALAEGALRSMFMNNVKTGVAVALALIAIGVSTGILLTPAAAETPSPIVAKAPTTPVAAPAKLDPAQLKADKATAVKDNSQFAVDFYQKLRAEDGNFFFSPYSISTALGMTYAGARGKTAEEMAKTMHFTLGQDRLHPAFGALTADLDGTGRDRLYQLSVANALWGQKDYKFVDDFLTLQRNHYGSSIHPVDFASDTEGARKSINKWVEEKTQDKIKELLKPSVLDSLTRFVLTNAIYFKGDWEHPFTKERTRHDDFHLAANKKIKVPMMHQRQTFKHFSGDTFQALEMTYKPGDLSMLVLLPKKVDGLPDLEKSLTVANLNAWRGKLKSEQIDLILPKFKVESDIDLKKTLISMGMERPFKDADLSGIGGEPGMLYLTAAVHKAFVAVDEKGTEAAAATAVVGGERGAPPPVPQFRADRPFIFLLQDNRSGSVLFIGRLTNPS